MLDGLVFRHQTAKKTLNGSTLIVREIFHVVEHSNSLLILSHVEIRTGHVKSRS